MLLLLVNVNKAKKSIYNTNNISICTVPVKVMSRERNGESKKLVAGIEYCKKNKFENETLQFV